MSEWSWILAVLLVMAVVGVVLRRSRRRVPDFGAPTGLEGRLDRSRQAIGGGLRPVFGRGTLDAEFWDGLEEVLIGADVGLVAANRIVSRIRSSDPGDALSARRLLDREVRAVFAGRERALRLTGRPASVLVVGANGTGKTTSIAKLARWLTGQGRTVLLGAADTFRAAADAQLRTWAERAGVEVVGGQEGADPAAVSFDAYSAARARGKDVVIIDTAGRLQSKRDLMEELGKVRRVLEREAGVIDEVLLVLDAVAGQNALAQARRFAEVAGVSGIVLSKLDGTAKGGIVVAIEEELGIPVKFVGVGEGMDDLVPFDPDSFVDAILGG